MVARAAEGLGARRPVAARSGDRPWRRFGRDRNRAFDAGLADRARIVDLFEHVIKGDVAAALGSSPRNTKPAPIRPWFSPTLPTSPPRDKAEYVPDAVNDQSLSESSARAGPNSPGSVAVTTLCASGRLLLQGHSRGERLGAPPGAAEMVLIRLAHAAHLHFARRGRARLLDLLGGEGGGARPERVWAGGGAQAPAGTPSRLAPWRRPFRRPSGNGATMLRAVPSSAAQRSVSAASKSARWRAPLRNPNRRLLSVPSATSPSLRQERDIKLKTMVRGFLRLVHIEPAGSTSICPTTHRRRC